jgi:hypothetical protein
MVIRHSPFLAVLAIVQIVAVEAFAAPLLEELIDAPDLESLGWNDGIMSGLLGDRRQRRDTSASNSDRALALFHDGLIIDVENSAEVGPAALVDLVGTPVLPDSVADPIRAELPEPDSEVDCSVWGDSSIPCEAP